MAWTLGPDHLGSNPSSATLEYLHVYTDILFFTHIVLCVHAQIMSSEKLTGYTVYMFTPKDRVGIKYFHLLY